MQAAPRPAPHGIPQNVLIFKAVVCVYGAWVVLAWFCFTYGVPGCHWYHSILPEMREHQMLWTLLLTLVNVCCPFAGKLIYDAWGGGETVRLATTHS